VRRIHEGSAPNIKNKSFRITADVVLPKGSEQGVLVTQGGLSGGYALMFENGKPIFHYNMAKFGGLSLPSH
jgi:arylsulfatase